ncbi:MAG: sensor histidine kinase [Herbinix sp.]|nr:sensor histidine kinase [Herbinix sp.]
MALTITLMAFFSILLAIRNIKNKYNLLFIMMLFGMTLSMFTIVSEIYKSSNYLVPSSYVYRGIEYNLFLLFSKLFRISLSRLQIIRNLGIITYLTAIMIFTNTFTKNVLTKNQISKQVKSIMQYTAFAGYIFLYFFFYHPNIAFNMYLIGNKLKIQGGYDTWVSFITIIDIIMGLLALLYMLYPVLLLIRNLLKNKISFFSEQLFGLAISITLLNTIFYLVFFTGAFRTSINDVYNYGFWRYKLAVIVPRYYATVLPMLSFIILLIILYITFKFKTDSMFNWLKERGIKKNLALLNSNLKDVLHSNKNIMFNVKILSEEALSLYGTPQGKVALEKIMSISNNHMDSITKALNNIRELKFSTFNNNLIDAIESALSEISIPDNIQLIKTYEDTEVYSNFDMYHIKQVIINLLANAIDAIYTKNSEIAHIKITVNSSMDWIYLSIEDNGIGIPRKLIRKIFNPYFSTKSKQNNWGIGLSYVFRIITAHYGHMRIKSKKDEYTNVEILLPRSKQIGGKNG